MVAGHQAQGHGQGHAQGQGQGQGHAQGQELVNIMAVKSFRKKMGEKRRIILNQFP